MSSNLAIFFAAAIKALFVVRMIVFSFDFPSSLLLLSISNVADAVVLFGCVVVVVVVEDEDVQLKLQKATFEFKTQEYYLAKTPYPPKRGDVLMRHHFLINNS